MLTRTVDVQKTPIDLRELLSWVAAGTEIIFMEGETPIARLVSVGRRVAGLQPGAIWTSEDFDEPLPEEFWAEAT
jgi:antitoxin (DNA-binding transcriptional repressor) of toxin-antitoxin stability system